MAMPPETLIVVALVILVGYTVFGATGFGASPITIPVLAHVLPLTFVLPLAALLDLGSGLVLGFHTRRQADTRELLTLVPFTLIGIWRHRILAAPEIAQPSETVAAPAEDVAALVAEAKREL